jgi:hypothetical protein
MGLTTYGIEEASHVLTLVAEGSASFAARARLEHYLLDLLRKQGREAVGRFLQSLPGHRFRPVEGCASVTEGRFVSAGSGPGLIVVTTWQDAHSVSVNVTAEAETTAAPVPDPRQQAFYGIWESLLGIPDSKVTRLDPQRKAVFLIGLLEAEVMNGGHGQYLANTDGRYFRDTVECLARIGAEKTRIILIEAGKLGEQAESCTAAWELYAREFEQLDERFLASGEDLAGLTAEVFIDGNAGKGPV